MSFPAYPDYKDSGVAWLGEVPRHWEVGGLKRYVAIIGGSTPKSEIEDYWDGSIPWVTPADLSRLSDFWISDTLRKITSEGLASCGTTLVPAGSVILSTRAPIGSLGIAKVELCTNQGCKALVPNGVDEKFLAYLLSISSGELNVRGRGSTFLELSADELGAFRIAFPPLTEQQSIVAFLDRETAKIDALMAEQERLIALLMEKRQAVVSHAVTKGLKHAAPMKDSGIEWLGKIPTHWEVVSLNRLIDPYRRITYGIVQPGPPDPTGRFMIRGQDYSRGWADPSEVFRVSDEIEIPYRRARLRQGDIVMTIVGAGTGNTAVVPEVYDGANITQTTARIAPNPARCRPEYLSFALASWMGETQVALFQKGAAQPGLNLEHLKALFVAVPPEKEQEEIACHLASASEQADDAIKIVEEAIALLEERRAALILAAVTGKIDVRGVVSQSNVVSIESARPSSLSPLRAVVGAYAIRELGPMGRMAVMKAGYLAEGHAGFGDLNGRYERYAAGPYDQSLIVAMERGAGEISAIVTHEPQDERKPVTYDVPKGYQPPSDALSALVGEDRGRRFLALLSLLKGIGRDGVEAVATLYAVWNDLLADGKAADADAICSGVLNDWHPEKARKFKRADLDHWLDWMRRNALLPDGSAPRTDNQGRLFAR